MAINPIVTGIGAGIAGAGALGGLFGGSKASPPDISGLLNTINQGAQRQTQIASGLPGQLSPLNTQLQTGVQGAIDTAQAARQKSAQDFLTSLGQNQNLQGQDTTKLLTEQAYQNVPQAEEAAREAAAATGGLQRGAAASLLAQPSLQAAEAVSRGTTQLDLQQQQQRAAALDKINTMDNSFIQQTLGIDKDTLNTLYTTGRQDLIDEANQLLGISQTQTQETLDAEQFGLSGQIAANAANASAQNQLLQSITGLGGTIAGYGLAGPAGGAAASTLPQSPVANSGAIPSSTNNPLLTSILGGGNPSTPAIQFDPTTGQYINTATGQPVIVNPATGQPY